MQPTVQQYCVCAHTTNVLTDQRLYIYLKKKVEKKKEINVTLMCNNVSSIYKGIGVLCSAGTLRQDIFLIPSTYANSKMQVVSDAIKHV